MIEQALASTWVTYLQRLRVAMFVGLSLSIHVESVRSQDQGSGTPRERLEITRVEELCRPVSQSVVKIQNEDRLCCLGTIVAPQLVLTKRSELSGYLTCSLGSGKKVNGTIIASDPLNDLALLQLNVSTVEMNEFGTAVELSKNRSIDVGDILLSVGTAANPISVGMAIVKSQKILIKQPNCQDCVDLGLTLAVASSEITIESAVSETDLQKSRTYHGTKIDRVYPRTVGERLGLLSGDLLVTLNQQSVLDANALRSIGAQVRVGQTLSATVLRNGSVRELSMIIERFSRRVFHDRWGGGPFSERRFGMGQVIVHDSLLRPDQCGGPIIDLEGNVVGINIARSLRVASFAISADRIRRFVNLVRPGTNP